MFPGSKHIATACAAALLVCTGCALQAPKPPLPDVPAAFENGAPGGQAAWPSKDWYRGFKSRELDALIAQAASANLDLAAARARLTQADARARQAGAAILPSVDATANGNYFAGHSVNGSAHEFDWSALLSASYEIDFWGKNRATANAGTFLGRGGARRSRQHRAHDLGRALRTDISRYCRCASDRKSPSRIWKRPADFSMWSRQDSRMAWRTRWSSPLNGRSLPRRN